MSWAFTSADGRLESQRRMVIAPGPALLVTVSRLLLGCRRLASTTSCHERWGSVSKVWVKMLVPLSFTSRVETPSRFTRKDRIERDPALTAGA